MIRLSPEPSVCFWDQQSRSAVAFTGAFQLAAATNNLLALANLLRVLPRSTSGTHLGTLFLADGQATRLSHEEVPPGQGRAIPND